MSVSSVVAKMQCHLNTETPQLNDPEQPHLAQIRLGAVWEGTTEAQRASENAIFGYWMPSGSVEMSIRNPHVSAFFKQGKKFYVTFTEAPD